MTKSLQDASERICELKGSLLAIDALLPALLEALPVASRGQLVRSFDAHAEAARAVMQHAPLFDQVLSTFDCEVARMRAVLACTAPAAPRTATVAALLTTTRDSMTGTVRLQVFKGACRVVDVEVPEPAGDSSAADDHVPRAMASEQVAPAQA